MMRTLTALEFANQLPSEKALTTRAIQEGRLRVVSPGEKGKEKKLGRTPEPLEGLRGKRCTVTLVNGDTLEGDLKEISKFEVVLSTGERSLIILKHGILFCEEALLPVGDARTPRAG